MTMDVAEEARAFVLARRTELAQADQNRAFVEALAALLPGSGASSLAVRGGWSNFVGANSSLSQAQALGFAGPLDASDLEAIEQHLGRDGGEVRIEVTPYADPSLPALLAVRGYAVREFQQVLTTSLQDGDAVEGEAEAAGSPGAIVREVEPEDGEAWSRVVVQGFMETDDIDDQAAQMLAPTMRTAGTVCFLALVHGEPAGGGSVGLFQGLATLSGTGVRVGFRGRGVQAALIRARLAFARRQGCDLAGSSTLAGTTSQRNLERQGFRVAYPKVVMARGLPTPRPSDRSPGG